MNTIVARSEPHRIFGITLRTMRERTEANQFIIAARAGVQKKSYAEYELGIKAPKDLDRVHRLCDVLDATEDERTAIIEVWGSIGSNNRIVHVTAVHDKQRQMGDPDDILHPVDPELRCCQDVIDKLKASDHDQAPYIWAGMLDAVKRIAAQGDQFLKRTTA